MDDKRIFKWGDQEYLLDDLLKLHAEQEQYYYDFAKDKGKYTDEAIKGLRSAIKNRIESIKNGEEFDSDGTSKSDKVDNVSIETRKGIFRKKQYVDQDNTEWAKHYLNKLVANLTPYDKNETKNENNSNHWDMSKFGLNQYLKGNGVSAKDVFERYDLYDEATSGDKKPYAQRFELLRKHLTKYRDELNKSNYNFTQNDNRWDDDFMTTLNEVLDSEEWNDPAELAAALRKLGADEDYVTAFTSDHWDLFKTDTQSKEDKDKKSQEEQDKLKAQYLDEWEDYAYNNYQTNKSSFKDSYAEPYDYTNNYSFREGITPSFKAWYQSANEQELSEYGTFLKSNEEWTTAWKKLMDCFKTGTEYEDKNKGILLQRTFEEFPNAFIDLNNGFYLIKDSITSNGLGTVYEPKSGYLSTIFLGEYANNSEIKNIYEQLGYDYINKTHGTKYDKRPDVFKQGGEMVLKYQLGDKVVYNWNSPDDVTKERADYNNVSLKTQKAKDQYMSKSNKSVNNPNAGWDTKHYVRLGAAIADLSAAIAGFVPGGGTVYAAGAGLLSTLTNFGTDLFDDAVTNGEMWRNLGLNLGMDLVGLVPGGGAASKMTKILRTLKSTVPYIIALPGVTSMLSNSPEIAASWKRAFDGKDGEKMDYQDYMNILQVLNVAAGAVNIGTNVYKSKKSNVVDDNSIAVEVRDSNNKRKALVLEGEDAKKFKEESNKSIEDAQNFLKNIEGGDKYTIVTDDVTVDRYGLKPWHKDSDGNIKGNLPYGRITKERPIIMEVRKDKLLHDYNNERLVKGESTKHPEKEIYAFGKQNTFGLGLSNKPDMWGDNLINMSKKPKVDDVLKQHTQAKNNELSSIIESSRKYKNKIDQDKRRVSKLDELSKNYKKSELEELEKNLQKDIKKFDKYQNSDFKKLDDIINKISNIDKKLKSPRTSEAQKTTLMTEYSTLLSEKLKLESNLGKDKSKNYVERKKNENKKIKQRVNELKNKIKEIKKIRSDFEKRSDEINKKIPTTNSSHFNSALNIKPTKVTINGVEHPIMPNKFNIKDIEYDFNKDTWTKEYLQSLGLFKQGGSINRNKLNKFLNYGKR